MSMREEMIRAGLIKPGDCPESNRREEGNAAAPSQDRATAICGNCGKEFIPRQPHHTQCDDCFQPRQRPSAPSQDRATAICGSCGKEFTPRQPHHKQCDDCFQPRQRPSGDRRSGGQPGRRAQSNQPRNMPNFPDSYFVKDEGNLCLRTEFVSKDSVDALAQVLASRGLSTGQLRRFFNHCREIERRLNVEGESWRQVAADFDSLSYHAQNAVASGRNFPREFQGFIDDNIKRVNSDDSPQEAFLRGFMQHFEALVGFGAAHIRDRR